jgi:hypothetical protein
MPFKSFISVVGSVLVALFVLWGVGRLVVLRNARDTAAQVALTQDTLEATKDTSRALPLIGVLGDSLRAAQRRAVQVEQRADELDKTLRLERVVRERLEALWPRFG